MNPSQFYIIVVIIIFLILFMVFCVTASPKNKRLSPLATLAFILILIGLLFEGNRLIGYGLIGVAIILSVADIFRKPKE